MAITHQFNYLRIQEGTRKEGAPTTAPTDAPADTPTNGLTIPNATNCAINQLDITSIEVPSNAFVGCANSANVCPDPDEPKQPDLVTVETP